MRAAVFHLRLISQPEKFVALAFDFYVDEVLESRFLLAEQRAMACHYVGAIGGKRVPVLRLWLHDLISQLAGSDIEISVAPAAAKVLVSDGKAYIAAIRAGRSLRAGVESGDGEETTQQQRRSPFPQPELFCNFCTHLFVVSFFEVRDGAASCGTSRFDRKRSLGRFRMRPGRRQSLALRASWADRNKGSFVKIHSGGAGCGWHLLSAICC